MALFYYNIKYLYIRYYIYYSESEHVTKISILDVNLLYDKRKRRFLIDKLTGKLIMPTVASNH